MKESTKDNINRYTSPTSCFFVGADGKLIKVTVPFRVKCIRQIAFYLPGDILKVSKVKTSIDLKIIYLIEDKLYGHSYFEF